MNEKDFEIDDIVLLKSGGPDMTIEKFIWDDLRDELRNDKVECCWFDGPTLNRSTFNISSLKHKED